LAWVFRSQAAPAVERGRASAPVMRTTLKKVLDDPERFPAALQGEYSTRSRHHGVNNASGPKLRTDSSRS
jgi:hypothetical protein